MHFEGNESGLESGRTPKKQRREKERERIALSVAAAAMDSWKIIAGDSHPVSGWKKCTLLDRLNLLLRGVYSCVRKIYPKFAF
jgi:hypothetical protein